MSEIIVVSGPSGVGKGTLIRGLIAADHPARVTISETTRPLRRGEVDGKDYHFVTEEVFKKRADAGHYIEWEYFFHTYYGTPKSELSMEDDGRDVLLELDPKGAISIKKAVPRSILVFVLPGSLSQLSAQLAARQTETEEQLLLREKRVVEELGLMESFEYVVINQERKNAISDFCELVNSFRFRMKSQSGYAAELILEARKTAHDL